MYRLGGDPARAGAAYESWGEFDAAIECFREAGDRARESDLLEKTGRYYEAAKTIVDEAFPEKPPRVSKGRYEALDDRRARLSDQCLRIG